MTLEEPSQKVDETIDYLRKLRKNPAEFERWADRVMKDDFAGKGRPQGDARKSRRDASQARDQGGF